MIQFSEVYVEFHDSINNEDVVESFKYPQGMTDEEIEQEIADMLHPFEFKILQ